MATKITATQRKHATQSLLSTYTHKQDAIKASFAAKPENRHRVVPMPVMPTLAEALKAIMGLEGPAVLRESQEAIIRSVNIQRGNFYTFNPLSFVQPLNHAAISEASSYNDVINQRYREEVDGRLALLRSAYTSACDVSILADSGDEVLRIVQEFDQREF